MTEPAVLTIDLRALQKNSAILKKLSRKNFFCPMIKTGAYGHGIAPVARALVSTGVKQAGVVSVEEARQIRKLLPMKALDILIFGPILNREDMIWLNKNRCVPVVGNWSDLKYLLKTGPSRIHLKFNTGFSRLGFALSEGEKLKKFLARRRHIQVEGLCSQLISNEDWIRKQGDSSRQRKRTAYLRSLFPAQKIHLFNTAGLLSSVCHGEKSNFGSRPGIGLYGMKPKIFCESISAEKKWREILLKPISSLKSRVVNIHWLERGEAVSYNGTWKAKRPSVIAVISIGYADGFPRALSNRGEVLFRGVRVPVRGRVCMDFSMIDLTSAVRGQALPKTGEEVVIFGKQKGATLSIEEMAEKSNTIPHALFVGLGNRIKRVYRPPKTN